MRRRSSADKPVRSTSRSRANFCDRLHLGTRHAIHVYISRFSAAFLALVLSLLATSACVGPHSSGALWSQQYVDQEKAYFALTDAQRREATTAFELSLADESLAAETQRLDAAQQACPGPRQPLQVSAGDKVRDGIRLQASGNADRFKQVSQLALTDWYLRRASATGDASYCNLAKAHPASQADANLLQRLPTATVTRNAGAPEASLLQAEPLVTLSLYALGSIDTVRAAPPLPQYLALVYGGVLLTDSQPVDAETAAAAVDAQAPAYPDWEPDALYAALRGAQL